MMNDPAIQLELARIKNNVDLPVPPIPHPPELVNSSIPIRVRLKLIQGYITSLEYNYTGEEYFVKKKDRGFRHVTSTARLITQEALPIRCVDAVFLGAYLTAEMADVDRYPVCFRSSLDGRVFRHIVLAVRTAGLWGALGLSRRDSLMYKELRYSSFSELIADFRESYAGSWHRLEQVWVGFPLPHGLSSNAPVKWKVMRATVSEDCEWESAARDLDRYVSCAPMLLERFELTGRIPDHPLLREASGNNGDADGNGECPIYGRDGVRSPGAPCNRLIPGGRRRLSLPIDLVTENDYGACDTGYGDVGECGEGEGKYSGGTNRSDATSASNCLILVVSPPRTRARSAWAGGVGRRSLNRIQRRTSPTIRITRSRTAKDPESVVRAASPIAAVRRDYLQVQNASPTASHTLQRRSNFGHVAAV